MNALQGRKSVNSPRKSAFKVDGLLASFEESSAPQPKQLFPASVSTEDSNEIPLKSLLPSTETTIEKESGFLVDELKSEIKILTLQNDELKRKLQLAQDRDALEAEAREVLIDTQTQLFLLQDQLLELRSQRDFERLERTTLQATFDAERAAFEESLSKLKKEIDSVKELKEERDWLQEALGRLQKENEAVQVQLADAVANAGKLAEYESNQQRLLAALKKGQQVPEVIGNGKYSFSNP